MKEHISEAADRVIEKAREARIKFDDATALATVEWLRKWDYDPIKDVDFVALKHSLTRDQAVGLIRRGLEAERLKRMRERVS